MDRTRICHCKSVEFICSVGKVILTDQNIQRADWFIRFILNGLFVYFLVERTSVLSLVESSFLWCYTLLSFIKWSKESH